MKTIIGKYNSADVYTDLIEESAEVQIKQLCDQPFTKDCRIAIMPDVHAGAGCVIGFTANLGDLVIPNLIGVDIGCGMLVVCLGKTEMDNRELDNIIHNHVPAGMNTHDVAAVSYPALRDLHCYNDLKNVSRIECSLGTLGGGNHFIEIQQDDDGMCGIMLHSGSRHFGNIVGQYFNKIAHELNDKWFSQVPTEWNLPFLPVDTDEGKRYLTWMQLCMDFAYENRAVMLGKVKEVFTKNIFKHTGITPEFSNEINCHHNYAALENHFGKNVWVHRKGAIRAREGDMGIIPGAMGSYSYIVRGKGCADSFMSSSHGAGRAYSRTAAMDKFSVESVMVDLKQQNVILAKNKKSDVAEESRFAYKDINDVMANQQSLTEPVKRLFTVGVVKG